MAIPKGSKALTGYIQTTSVPGTSTLVGYASSPASTFLSEAVHYCDAINHCIRHFPIREKSDEEFTRDSQDSLFRLGASTLAALMGHFELFQRYFFAGIVEATRLSPSFDIRKCCRVLEKDYSLGISLSLLSSYRGQPAQVGLLIADSLSGWHDPETVNGYLKAIVGTVDFYSNSDVKELRILWQLRHSIVHTAGWITQPDAQKVDGLQMFASQPIHLEPRFVEAVVKRFHKILPPSVARYEGGFKRLLNVLLPPPDQAVIDQLFKVETPRTSWL